SWDCPTACALLAAWSYWSTPERVTPHASAATSKSIARRERSRYQCDDMLKSMLLSGGAQIGGPPFVTVGLGGNVGSVHDTCVIVWFALLSASCIAWS